ncbi:hypothetical protein McanMca71_007618 [Microsporum canis]|uniref:PX domain-containing protein n=1 Tax=Arthroderma otae (strain ATCC MYA-4605 / CBS 113480) TaxID=554155 RepID=C5FYV3_ARTOC|nr:PX domain-containing protein [Microsporum canis CBS 113480]EEQ34701.1 PX domain-containing protein [Microsporum canis CBS 113480]
MSIQAGSQASPSQRPSWTGRRPETMRGLLVEGKWKCDCEPRRAASHLETKNGGKNHGRWFYTCSKPRDKGCGFFLWDDAAKEREAAQKPVDDGKDNADVPEAASIQTRQDNAKSRPILRTPKANRIRESILRGGLLTPESHEKRKRDADITDYLDQYQSPTKRGRLDLLTSQAIEPDVSPFTDKQDISYPSLASRLDVMDAEPISRPSLFSTPKKATTPPRSVVHTDKKTPLNLPTTPTPSRFVSSSFYSNSSEGNNTRAQHCELTKKALDILESHKTDLSPKAKQDLAGLLDRNDLRTLGIIKGRDISRLAIKERESRIKLLERRVALLEAERESWKALSLNGPSNHPDI